jgi:hypothetical protein
MESAASCNPSEVKKISQGRMRLNVSRTVLAFSSSLTFGLAMYLLVLLIITAEKGEPPVHHMMPLLVVCLGTGAIATGLLVIARRPSM